jgi:hypothetical protein
MAGTAQNPTFNFNIDAADRNQGTGIWVLTTANTDGVALEMTQFTDLCWQVSGIGATGAVCNPQGSNDGTTWANLTNAAGGAAATFSADGLKQTIERPRYVRAALTTPGAAATITVTLLLRRNPAPASN